MNKSKEKQLGQYFTVSEELQQFVFDVVSHKSSLLLEPSFGAGHLLKKFVEYNNNYKIVGYELDDTVKPIIPFNRYQTLIYGDFTSKTIRYKFKTIVGNPPYVKQKDGNLYLKFIEICYSYLADDGELVFIVPSDFIKLTRASSIINTMNANGSFTHFLFPHNEKLFEGASIDVLVFRYEKGKKTNKAIVNNKEMFCNVNKGIITFSNTKPIEGTTVESTFNVYVGLVSGREEIYRAQFGNIDVLIDKDKVVKYIFTETFPTGNEVIDEHLLKNKEELLNRKIKKFSEKDWFKWGAPRNISNIEKYQGKPCIYIRNMTRKKEVAFLGKVQYFGGTLLCFIPRDSHKPTSERSLKLLVDYFNTEEFQKDYIYSGRFKMGHKIISSAVIPSGDELIEK